MYGAVVAVRYVLFDSGYGGATRMGVLIASGAMVYCAASFIFNRKGVLEVLGMIRSIALSKRASPMQS